MGGGTGAGDVRTNETDRAWVGPWRFNAVSRQWTREYQDVDGAGLVVVNI